VGTQTTFEPLEPHIWRMLLSGQRERIADAVAQIAPRHRDDYAAMLVEVRRRDAVKARRMFRVVPHARRYSERQRRSALTALSLMWGSVGREIAIALDPKASYFDRVAAHRALVRRKDQRAVRPLIEALNSGNALEDWRCIATLGELGDLRAAAALLEYMRLGEDNDLDVPLRCRDVGIEVGKALRGLDAKAAFGIAGQCLGSGNPTRRAAGALVVAGWGDEALGPALLPLLTDSSPLVRAAAAVALGELKVFSALDVLYERIGELDGEVRAAAEQAIQQITKAQAERVSRARRRPHYALPRRAEWNQTGKSKLKAVSG
jgi:HEAT repeat protein